MPFCKAYFGLHQMSCFNAGAIQFLEFKPLLLGIDIRVGNGFLLPQSRRSIESTAPSVLFTTCATFSARCPRYGPSRSE